MKSSDDKSILDLDLASTPFSRRGSYFALSRTRSNGEEGLYIRTTRGGAGHREVARIVVGGSARPASSASGGRLVLSHQDSRVEISLAGSDRVILRLVRGSLDLEFATVDAYDTVLQESGQTWRFLDWGARRNFRVEVFGGYTSSSGEWDGLRSLNAVLAVSCGDEPVVITVDDVTLGRALGVSPDIDKEADAAQSDFEAWYRLHGGDGLADEALVPVARRAAFITWSALVPPGGMFGREAMFMSKNWMTNVWSWDHCFNALALWRDPAAALGQLLVVFDHQDDEGCLPDWVNDANIQRNFVKPPIHGWAVGRLMDWGGLAASAVERLYEPLSRWTEWWFDHRVYGENGVPSYYHGNDSGWDNATIFAAGVPVQSPDVLAFLAVQMATLARMAQTLNRHDESMSWRRRADAAVITMVDHFWVDGRFIARSTLSSEVIAADSLITCMPIVLGRMLPRAQLEATVRRLREEGFLTDHGLATEPVDSPLYEPDGYWRGPIWAPATMLIVDGLRRAGEAPLADEISRRFIATCSLSGMAENFDALTGAALRDRSYTWTASVFLCMVAPPPDMALQPAHTASCIGAKGQTNP